MRGGRICDTKWSTCAATCGPMGMVACHISQLHSSLSCVSGGLELAAGSGTTPLSHYDRMRHHLPVQISLMPGGTPALFVAFPWLLHAAHPEQFLGPDPPAPLSLMHR